MIQINVPALRLPVCQQMNQMLSLMALKAHSERDRYGQYKRAQS
jgi:hypothetical protein